MRLGNSVPAIVRRLNRAVDFAQVSESGPNDGSPPENGGDHVERCPGCRGECRTDGPELAANSGDAAEGVFAVGGDHGGVVDDPEFSAAKGAYGMIEVLNDFLAQLANAKAE